MTEIVTVQTASASFLLPCRAPAIDVALLKLYPRTETGRQDDDDVPKEVTTLPDE